MKTYTIIAVTIVTVALICYTIGTVGMSRRAAQAAALVSAFPQG